MKNNIGFIISLFLFSSCTTLTPVEKVPDKHCYELTKEQLNSFVQVPKDTLQVQYIDDYTSVENITSSIYNVESQQIVSTTQNIIVENINGVNRIKINLGLYSVVAGKSYLLVISNFKSNYYFGFKIKN